MNKINTLLVGFLFGMTSVAAQSPGNSLDFDGTNDHVSSALPTVFNDIPNNDFTIEAWIKPNASVFSRVVFAQFDATNFASISLSASNQVYFYVSNVAGINTSATLPLGSWSHVACTWDASTSLVEIYINGILQTSGTGGTSSLGNDNLMTLGSKTDGTQLFQGEMDEVRIWDVIRTPCEINSAMSSEFTVSQPNLVAYYNFNQGVAGGSNVGINSLPDFTTNYDGTLLNFGLSGANSNWLASGAGITTVNQSNVVITGSTDIRTECDVYTWIDGNTYTSSNNTATHTLMSAAGCDSIVTLDLTITNSTSGIDVQTACDSYTWIDGNTYTSSNNTATHTLTNAAGCDSIVTLNLTMNTVDLGITNNSPTLVASASPATYQWVNCDENYNLISGETNSEYTPQSNGNYAVIITQNGCTDTTACEIVNNIGLLKQNIDIITLHPNPTSGDLHLKASEKIKSIQVYSTTGQLILQEDIDQKDYSFSLSAEPKGVYLISINTEKSSITKRVVKQ
ncbi:MAG: LamG-like jellyroll fold domain-containing protein [Brumimicrobium sp.]